MADFTKVGVGVLIFKDGKVLLGKRKNAHGAGSYAGTGGHLDFMESLEEAVRRETREETGIEIDNLKFLCVSNLKFPGPKHYIDIGFTADWKEGVVKTMEPEKCEGWEWYDMDKIPKPHFGAVENYIEAYKTGRRYFDA